MPVFDPKKRGEYKFRIRLSLGVLLFLGLVTFSTETIGPGFWELVMIGAGFALASIVHSGWAIWNADSTRHCNFTHGMMREAAIPKCFSPSKVKEHECAPITASLRVSVTKFMR